MFLVASPHFGRLTLKWKQGLSVVFLSHSLCIYSSSDEECFQSCGVWYSVQSNRMLLGLLQNLEMGHPTQKSLNHTGSCRECRTITIALPMLILFQVCQISSNQLFLGVVLSFLLWRLFICALGATVIGGEGASILKTRLAPFLLYGQCFLPVSPVLTHWAFWGPWPSCDFSFSLNILWSLKGGWFCGSLTLSDREAFRGLISVRCNCCFSEIWEYLWGEDA